MGLRIGVVGTGRLGREHVRVLCGLDETSRVVCHDINSDRSREVAGSFGATHAEDIDTLLAEVDAVSIVVPTTAHAEIARRALESGKDVFIEKPIARTLAEAGEILDAAERAEKIVQVGHVERFNGAIEAVLPQISDPLFIEVHRLSGFSVRGTDVSVVTDLMIHDLDLLGCIVPGEPTEIRANGAGILTEGPDIINVRLEYPGGCVANVTASRISAEAMRKIRIFSPSQYISIDLLRGSATVYRKADTFDEEMKRLRTQSGGYERLNLGNFVQVETISPDPTEPLEKELRSFCTCVRERTTPPVTGEDGRRALALANNILARIQ